MQHKFLEKIDKQQEKKRPFFSVGDKVTIALKLKEGEKERIQEFKGIVIAKHPKSGRGPSATFTVRKISQGVGVERIFPVHSPMIDKIEIDSSSAIRRSRLYYLRALSGKKGRLKERETFGENRAMEEKLSPIPEAISEAQIASEAQAPSPDSKS